jgi:hypothetical protein
VGNFSYSYGTELSDFDELRKDSRKLTKDKFYFWNWQRMIIFFCSSVKQNRMFITLTSVVFTRHG